MSLQRNLVVLLRDVENRLCADCDAPLGENAILGSYSFGCWICHRCANVHRNLGPELSCIKSSHDQWTDEEVIFCFIRELI